MLYESLSKSRLLAALRRLGELDQAEGIVLEVSLDGGAVFTLVYTEHIATQSDLPVPAWCAAGVRRCRGLRWGELILRSRVAALRDSPPAFKARDLYTPAVDLPLRLAAGRPTVSLEVRRQANAARQQRLRERRQLNRRN